MSRSYWIIVALLLLPNIALAQTEANICVTAPLPSECVTYEFSVDVDTVADPATLFGNVMQGDTITGTFTLNSAALDIVPASDRGSFTNALECMRVAFADRDLALVNTPVPVDADPDDSDPGIDIRNDVPNSVGGFSLFTDTVALVLAGDGVIDILATPGQPIPGVGGLGAGYGDSCIDQIDTPCPLPLVTDDMLPPPAPGDMTSVDTAQFHLQYGSLQPATASLFGTFTRIDASGALPCPEPNAQLAWPLSLLTLAAPRRAGRAKS